MPRALVVLLIAAGGLALTPAVGTLAAQQGSGKTPPDQLFARIYPVFAHPRCANCHGVVQHFPGFTHSVTPETHPGGDLKDFYDPPDNPSVDCTSCHKETGNRWQFTAPPNMEWAGLEEDQVCVMEAAEVRLRNAAARGAGANVSGSYLDHLASDPLIQQAWVGYAGGARDRLDDSGRPVPPLPRPPLEYARFLEAAQKWVDAGAPCRTTIQVSQVEEQKSQYTVQNPGQTIEFKQGARRQVNAVRLTDGSATATVTANGWNETVTTLDAGNCVFVTSIRNEWTRTGPPRVAAKLDVTVKPDEYVLQLELPSEIVRTHTVSTATNTCGAPNPDLEPLDAEQEWSPWIQSIRCPTEFPAGDGTMGCIPTELNDVGATDGALHQTVADAVDAPEPRTWLARSRMAIARTDTGLGLPVHVKAIWSVRLDQK
jgi:hypothetical protein